MMLIKIEFQHCDLEILHIGMGSDIAFQELQEGVARLEESVYRLKESIEAMATKMVVAIPPESGEAS